MRTPRLFTISALVASLLLPISGAHALTVESVAAKWVNTYTSSQPSVKRIVTRSIPKSGNIEAVANFVINYTGVPEEAKPAIQAAVDAWSVSYPSTVPITVNADFVRQGSGGILASATPVKFFHGFTGAPDPDLWYPSAMANALAGKDLDPSNPEISIRINSTMIRSFYLGTDGNCPQNQYDLESILLHELGHGLGFLSNDTFDPLFGYGSIDQSTPYDAYAQLSDGRRLMDLDSPSTQLGVALVNTLVWSGKNGIAANNGVKPKLYTPNPYLQGSSISHLDEDTFSLSGANSVMTPNLGAGEVFHQPGPLLIAMLQDMRLKPPAGIPVGVPKAVRNLKALIGDKSAVVSWDAPSNSRTAQVTSYTIKVNQTGQNITTAASPVTITGLKNSVPYSFAVTASNVLGTSEAATSNPVLPQAGWKSTVIDPAADAKYLAVGTFQGKQIIAYSDSKNGDLKLATWNGKSWTKTVVDGNSKFGGKTTDDVSGYISLCTSKVGKLESLNIFYGDLTNKDLRYASYNGTKWIYDLVDGNGPIIQPYKESARVRTASDVSFDSACVATPAGIQVFYRDESQGILLGAVRVGATWRYELVDGDRDTDGRSTGDVAFHLKATAIGNSVYVAYDSVIAINADKKAIKGEVRMATRASAYPEDWIYSTVSTSGNGIAVTGFDVATYISANKISAVWLTASGLTVPNPDQLQYGQASLISTPMSVIPDPFGTPSAPIATNGEQILFGCSTRLCSLNIADQTIALVSTASIENSVSDGWVTLKGVKYALIGLGGKLTLFKP